MQVRLETRGGQTLASQTITGLTPDWKEHAVELTPSTTDPQARLLVGLDRPGEVFLDMLSLFPKDTYKGRTNGMRKDLAELIAGLNPGVVRFPGGCFVEGAVLALADRWKWTVGPLAERKGHWGHWGYYSTGGLGFFEYLQFCEDISAEPLFNINAGFSHEEMVPMNRMGPGIQDALDAIEYANGPATSTWGALRAAAGHPEPFHLKYIEIGNENFKEEYYARFAMFYKAIKEKHPDMVVIANNVGGPDDWPKNCPPDVWRQLLFPVNDNHNSR